MIRLIRVILFISIFLIYTCFKAVQISPNRPDLMIFVAILFFVLMISSVFLSRIKPTFFEKVWFKIISWIGSMFMGLWGTFIIISFPIDIFFGFISLFNHGHSFLNQNAWISIFALSVLLTFVGFIEALRGPIVKNIEIPIENLADDLVGLKIAQISDLHIGPTIQTRYVEKVVKITNAINPDLIVITGDLADAHTESIKKHLQPLRHLKSRFGIFYVTGNHEYYWSVDTLLPELKSLGFKILMSSNEILDIGNSKILIAGIPDPMGKSYATDHKPDLAKARESDTKTELNILLAHRPDPYELAEKYGFHLLFAGHTHAGQFFPFSLIIPFVHKYYKGLNRHGKIWLYVNPGTGYWGPANRFAIASEITLACLRKV